MKRRIFIGATLSFTLLGRVPAANATSNLQLIKDPNCGCCSDHAAYLREHGFTVDIVEATDLQAIKNQHGVPDALAGCHTILAENYVIEGHVPAAAIKKLLAERPTIKGISLPGMPMGSPGMNGEKEGPFEVVVLEEGMPKLFYRE